MIAECYERNAAGQVDGYNDRCSDYLFIPSIVDGEEMTGIRHHVFRDNELDLVYIPDTVEWIGSFAFHNNNLSAVEIPDSVTTIG